MASVLADLGVKKKKWEGPARWEWTTNSGWTEYGPQASRSIEASFQAGERFCHFWKNGLLHEVDLKIMQQTPTQRRVQRNTSVPDIPKEAPPVKKPPRVPLTGAQQRHVPKVGVGLPIEKRASILGDRQITMGPFAIGLAKSSPELPELPQSPASSPSRMNTTGMKAMSMSMKSMSKVDLGASQELPDIEGTQVQAPWPDEVEEKPSQVAVRMMHPLLVHIPEPHFIFDADRYEPIAIRKGEAPVDCIELLAQEYSKILSGPSPALPLVEKGPHYWCMAGASLALYAAGIYPHDLGVGSGSKTTSSLKKGKLLSMSGMMRSISFSEADGSRPNSSMLDDRPPTSQSKATERSGTAKSTASVQAIKRRIHKGMIFSLWSDNPTARAHSLQFREKWREWVKKERELASQTGLNSPLYDHANNDIILNHRNSGEARFERLVCAANTLRHILSLRNGLGPVKDVMLLKPFANRPKTTGVHGRMHAGGTSDGVCDCAVRLARQGKRVAMVIPCSPVRVGGAFLAGRHRGQEEEACMRSSFFPLLWEAYRKSKAMNTSDSWGRATHIPDDGLVLIRDVEFFRENHEKGYIPMPNPMIITGVMCIQFANMIERAASAEQDYDGEPVGILQRANVVFETTLRQKMNAVLRGAKEIEADVIIISDEKAEDLNISSQRLGEVWGEEVAGMNAATGHLPQLVLAGTTAFRSAFVHALGYLGKPVVRGVPPPN